jgi:hypothetical protein
MQAVVQKIADRLPGWMRRFFHTLEESCWSKEATGGGGGEWEPNKILSQELDICPMFKIPSKKPLKESDEKY